jgi:predicted RNase H-related nuclease YkuK (DUF458 family)
MFKENEIIEIREYLENTSPESSVYLGCDSLRIKKRGEWFALYTTVLVVHKDGKHGCKLFGYNVLERDYDRNEEKPMMRLMNEAYKVVELYQEFEDNLILFDNCEIHLDVNPDKQHNSSIAVRSAVGYVLGTCGIEPKIKPEAFAASYAADRMVRGKC